MNTESRVPAAASDATMIRIERTNQSFLESLPDPQNREQNKTVVWQYFARQQWITEARSNYFVTVLTSSRRTSPARHRCACVKPTLLPAVGLRLQHQQQAFICPPTHQPTPLCAQLGRAITGMGHQWHLEDARHYDFLNV